MNDARLPAVRFGEFLLDETNARLTRDGRPVEVPPKAFELLCVLVRRPGQLHTKDALLDAVWGHRHFSESVLKTTVSQLRTVLEDDARAPRYIETASRRGYRFVAAISAEGTAPWGGPDPGAPMSVRDAPDDGQDLVGREGPLRALRECLAAACAGRPQVVFVAGEPGIGKSTLIERFLGSIPPPGPAKAFGQCVELYGKGEPYMPVLEALNGLCREADGADLAGLMRQVAPTWLAQMPWLVAEADRNALQREVAGATQERMLREFGELVDRFTARRPVLLVLEDLHWSDHATVQLVGYLARRRLRSSLMLLASFRPAEIIVSEHPLAGLRQELKLHELCRELDLETLSEAEVGDVVAARLRGTPAPEDFVRALHSHTEGLPLFVINVLDDLLAEGLLRRGADGWVFPGASCLPMPSSIAGVIEKQAARLPAALQAWLGAASVAGVEFLHAPLADALETDPDRLQQRLDEEAARGHWLRGAGVQPLPDGRLAARYAFRHVLYRNVFYRRQGEAQRVRWHRRLARALAASHGARSGEIAAELAMHHQQGHEPVPAIEQLRIVSSRALARSASREALEAARLGLRLLAGLAPELASAERELDLRVQEALALARLHVISEPQVAQAFERAHGLCERVKDTPAIAPAVHGLWWVSFAQGDLAAAGVLARRLRTLGHVKAPVVLRLAGHSATGVTLTMRGDLREAKRHLVAARALSVAVGDDLPAGLFVQDPGVESSAYLALVCWWTGEPARARRLGAEAVERAFAIRHPVSQIVALNLAAALHNQAGEYLQTLELTERLVETIRAEGLPDRKGGFTWLHGRAVAARGQVQAGLDEMRAGERSCRALGMLIGTTAFYFQQSEVLRDAGQVAQALESSALGIEEAERRQERFLLPALLRQRGELLCARGDFEEGKSSLARALDLSVAQGFVANELATLAAWCRLPGGATRARRARLAELLARYEDDPSPVMGRLRAALGP